MDCRLALAHTHPRLHLLLSRQQWKVLLMVTRMLTTTITTMGELRSKGLSMITTRCIRRMPTSQRQLQMRRLLLLLLLLLVLEETMMTSWWHLQLWTLLWPSSLPFMNKVDPQREVVVHLQFLLKMDVRLQL